MTAGNGSFLVDTLSAHKGRCQSSALLVCDDAIEHLWF